MKQPQALQRGDLVAIVTTARKIDKDAVQLAIELLESWGLNVVLGRTIGLEDNQYGGTDSDRAIDFQQAMDDPVVKAIWCARGGYGTVRIIDALDFTEFVKQPKWVIGFSDVTVLHSHLHNIGVQTLHAIMPITVEGNTIDAITSLKNDLFGMPNNYELPFEVGNKLGKETGVLIGGNLSMLYSLLGSKSAIDTTDKILFIEDLDEYLYHIDRMMMNLKRNGYFDNLKGLIVGGMTKMHDNDIPFGKTAEEIILDAVAGYNFPVAFNVPAGHVKDNRSLHFGETVEFNVTDSATQLKFI
ncbi:MAG: S66 peptidase family protein [Flavobacteriaceae bacterium]